MNGETRVKRTVDGATFWLRQELLMEVEPIVQEISDEEWAQGRESAVQRAFGISADEFRRRYRNGSLPPGKQGKISNLLKIFPELADKDLS